ncbi:MAG: TIGR04211 family SH3 domain-containing protein [Gammaproteobacteria bacterium]|nr:TIGR04211 family SH3 domain-containing protein [Gammaproteobacteria bacterium]
MKKLMHYKMYSLNAFKTALTAVTLGVLLLVGQSSAMAATKGYTNYVTDSVDIPVRRGAGYKYKISHMLKSGTPVKIIEVDSKGWASIQFKKGNRTITGWMPSSVLQNQPIAKVRLEKQVAKTSSVEEKFNALQQELDTLKVRFESSDTELSSIKQEKFEQANELSRLKALSSNAVQLDEQNQQMKKRLNELENQNAIMKEQIDQSDDSVRRQWFLTGGGVLLLGLLMGRFFRPPAKRKNWGEI